MSGESTLQRLSKLSAVVPETAELSTIRELGSEHVNLTAARITAAAQRPEQAEIVDRAVSYAQKKVGKRGNRKLVAIHAVERLAVEFGTCVLEAISGDVSVELDGRLAYKRRGSIDRGRDLIAQFEELGADKNRILLKLPATWEGIEAATKLREKDGIRCHMTLVFGMHQLAACADAGAAVIAPAVGRITDWHKKRDGVDSYRPEDDPGVKAAVAMYEYLTRHGYDSILMPGTFRSVEQALALAGAPRITLPPKVLTMMAEHAGSVTPQINADGAAARGADKLEIDKMTFAKAQGADAMSKDKLMSGVKNLSWAVVSQERQLIDWICSRQDEAAESSTLQLFKIWDYDGDGFATDEEVEAGSDPFDPNSTPNNTTPTPSGTVTITRTPTITSTFPPDVPTNTPQDTRTPTSTPTQTSTPGPTDTPAITNTPGPGPGLVNVLDLINILQIQPVDPPDLWQISINWYQIFPLPTPTPTP